MPCFSRIISEMLPKILTGEKCNFLKPIDIVHSQIIYLSVWNESVNLHPTGYNMHPVSNMVLFLEIMYKFIFYLFLLHMLLLKIPIYRHNIILHYISDAIIIIF